MLLENYFSEVNNDNLKNKTFREIFTHSNYLYLVNEKVYYIDPGDFIIEDSYLPKIVPIKVKNIQRIINSKLDVNFIINTKETTYNIKYIPIVTNPTKFPRICKEEE